MADAHMLKNLSLSLLNSFSDQNSKHFNKNLYNALFFSKLGHPILQLVMCQYIGIPKNIWHCCVKIFPDWF